MYNPTLSIGNQKKIKLAVYSELLVPPFVQGQQEENPNENQSGSRPIAIAFDLIFVFHILKNV